MGISRVMMDHIGLLVCLCCVLCAVDTLGERTGGAGSFAGGQVKVMTSRGAPVHVYREYAESQDDEEDEEGFRDDELEGLEETLQERDGAHDASEDLNEASLRERSTRSRNKRVVPSNQWHAWPKGIVPYTFNMAEMSDTYRDEALAAFTRWHKYTCIRFVPWVKGETMQKYGLTEESHLSITKESGRCRAIVGNYHSSSGQLNSCCWRSTCTHELGHSLALWHEHASPWRGDFIQLVRNRVPEGKSNQYISKLRDSVDIYQYDLSNRMHYPGWQFNVLYEDLNFLKGLDNVYYMYKDVSLYHKCHELHCNNAKGQCHNGGFVTLVDGRCSCLCPPGLDPGTDCGTAITRVSNSPSWPADAFAMLSPVSGCPSPVFADGRWQHQGEGQNTISSEFHLAGTFNALIFHYKFCVKQKTSTPSAADVEWEPGRYCILRAGGACPKGFKTGFIEYGDKAGNVGQREGSLPDGVFVDGTNTRLEFCCRDDGFLDTPLSRLPNTQPLTLFESQGGKSCQTVAGMHWTEEFMWFDKVGNGGSVGGSHPRVEGGTKLWFCHYVPVKYDCGGTITLSKSSPRAVVTSPLHPQPYGTNMECNWIIKSGDPDGQVVVFFAEFKVDTSGGCKDSLEIRYNLPGQPGLRYCGDGQSRTIRSIKDTVILTLRTDHHSAASDIGFKATAFWYLPKEQGCYPADNRGSTYRGTMSYTRGMKACLPWAEMTHCRNYQFHPRDFGADLEKNYCRNPDNTAMPWCYVDAGCRRDYCDVCNVESIYDKSKSCKSEICAMDKEAIFNAGCAKTCNVQPPPIPDRNAVCTIPGQPPSDATFAPGSQTSGTVPVGGTISFRCRTGSEQVTWTCLTGGTWSGGKYVCGACDDGWAYYKGACYKYYFLQKTFSEASEVCSAHGAVVSPTKDREEMTFVSSLRMELWHMWNGATDTAVEGQFRWQDGSLVDWFNWHPVNTPNNNGNQDCVEVYTEDSKMYWDDVGCAGKKPFVCKYQLSDRKICVDRRSDCVSTLRSMPGMCVQQKALADQMCAYTCGLCQADATPKCAVPATSDDVILVSHQGETSVSRGQTLQYKCKEGLALAQGALFLACGADGKYMASPPVCKNPDDTTQDSNDVLLRDREKWTDSGWAYSSLGSSLTITRNGVIKQWKFHSLHAGFTFFQVWRPKAGAGKFTYSFVGQNQVLSTGLGRQTYDLAQADWIRVQPGDRIGIYEHGDFRGYVPYDNCLSSERPEDYGAMWAKPGVPYGDFSPSAVFQFDTGVTCMTFSFKAVIHPVTSVPAKPDLATSHVGRVSRYSVGAAINVYLGDSANFQVPADGSVTEWQFYANHGGTGAFQVWRKRADLGTRKYEFVGQNEISLASDQKGMRSLKVPAGERIAVKAGDIIGFLYGSNRLGIPYNLCPGYGYPESSNIHWYGPLTPGEAVAGKVYSFGVTGGTYLCRVFSFRAIVEQA